MGEQLNFFKRKLLMLLDLKYGIKVRETQVFADLETHLYGKFTVRREDVRQALNALMDSAHVARRMTELNGWTWKVTEAGHEAAQRIDPEEELE